MSAYSILKKCVLQRFPKINNLSPHLNSNNFSRNASVDGLRQVHPNQSTSVNGHIWHEPCTLLQNTCLAVHRKPALVGHYQVASFHTSIAARGLEEFFDDPKNWGQPSVKAGRAWSKDELRLHDPVTLHKLWYTLLKEKNMLLSMQAEADRLEKFLPNPERITKVEVSMGNLQAVLKERQEALTELQTGHPEEHPGRWEYTPFGYKRYVKPKEYIMPKYMNKYYATKRQWYDPSMGRYLSRWYEQIIKRGARNRRRRRSQLLKLKKRFPNADVWEDK